MKKRTFQAKLRLPENLAGRVMTMAEEREMKVDDMLSELVCLGEMSLRQNAPSATDQARSRVGEAEYVIHRS